MPKPKKQKWSGGKGVLSEELDAYDYEYDNEYYPPEPKAIETPLSPALESQPSPKPSEKPNANAFPKPKEVPKEVPKEPAPEPEAAKESYVEPVLEQFDDWEQAIDALDAAVSKQEEIKANARGLHKS